MIQLATQQDARREITRRKRAYSGRGFGPRSFECISIGIGLSIDKSGALIPTSPLAAIKSTTVKLWTDSQIGAGANAWTDQSGLNNHFTEATNPPVLTSVGGVPCYVSNGTNQLFTATALTLTLGQWYWIIARQISWQSNGSLCGGAASASATIMSLGLVTPQLSQFNGTQANVNANMTPGAWVRVKALFSNTTGDYLQFGPLGGRVTGANAGPSTETGWQIFTRQSFGWGNFAIAAVVVAAAAPTGPEQAALDAYGAARWPTVAF